MSRTRDIAIGVLCLTCVARSALADPAPNPDAKRHAEESFAAGLRNFDSAEKSHDSKLYDDAYYEFAKAYAIYPEDRTLWNLALSEVESGREVQGLRHLREYDRRQHVTEQPSHPKNKVMREYLERASRATSHIVVSAPSGASLRVDGEDAGVSPLASPLDVLPGDHVVEAMLVDGSHRESIHPAAGQTIELQFVTAPTPAVAPTTNAPLPVVAPPSNEEAGATWWTPSRDLGVGLGGVALAGLVLGFVMHSASSNNTDHVNSLRGTLPLGSCQNGSLSGPCVDLHDSLDAANRDATLSTVSFVVAGAAAVGGVALVVLGGYSRHTQTSGVQWTPVISPWNVGVRGSF